MAACEDPSSSSSNNNALGYGSQRYFPGDSLSNPWAVESQRFQSGGAESFPYAQPCLNVTLAAASAARGPGPMPSPAAACPILPSDWRGCSSSPATAEFALPSDRTGASAMALNTGGAYGSCSAGTSPSHSGALPLGSTAGPASNPGSSVNMRLPKSLGLREQLLRASSIPPQSAQDGMPASELRRKSLSFLAQANSPADRLLEQQLSMQLQRAEQQWRRSEGEDETAAAEDALGLEREGEEWFDLESAEPTECLNWREVEELCANMDIAGMRVEDVDIFCPPLGLVPEALATGMDHVLLSLKFEGMTLRHYPGDHRAKELFHAIISA